MPIVFVHGVFVRQEQDSFLSLRRARNQLFREITLSGLVPGIDPQAVKIFNPYWGGDAAAMAWGGRSMPGKGMEEFGGVDEMLVLLAQEALVELEGDSGVKPENLLPQLARAKGLPRATDFLWPAVELSIENGTQENENENEVSQLAAVANDILNYADKNEDVSWLFDVEDNSQFTERLLVEVTRASEKMKCEDDVFGIADYWERIKNGASKLGDSAKVAANQATALATNPVIGYLRPSLNKNITMFVGDVFCYIQSRERDGENSPIVAKVSEAICEAAKSRTEKDPLLIVGHSMGGNICYDILSSFLKDKVECDFFVTVGSQVGLFEELKLFNSSDLNVKMPDVVPKPSNIKKWINVFDYADILSYQAENIFGGIDDFQYNSGETVMQAHGAYLIQPRFHERLNARLRGI